MTHPRFIRIRRSVALWLALATVQTVFAVPEDRFALFDLAYEGEFAGFHAEDLNNDGLCDLILFSRQSTGGLQERRAHLFFQQLAGFAGTPDQSLTLPADLIVFDFGDVQGDWQKELVYIGPSEVRFLKLHGARYKDDTRLHAAPPSLFVLPNPNEMPTQDFVRDLNNDKREDMIFPGIHNTVVRIRQPSAGEHWSEYVLPLASTALHTLHFDPHFSVGQRTAVNFMAPDMLLANVDGDQWPDMVAVYRDSLVFFSGTSDGGFAASSRHREHHAFGDLWKGEKIQRSRLDDLPVRRFLLRLVDLNNDSLLDAVCIRVSTEESLLNPETRLFIYFGSLKPTAGRPHLTFGDTPDQVIEPNGSVLMLRILDLNADGRQDLVMPLLRVSLPKLLKMLVSRTLDVEAEHYQMKADGFYPDKPDSQDRLAVRFSFRGGATSPVYELSDFTGDGFFDMLTSTDEEQLLLFEGKANGQISTNSGIRYRVALPQDGTRVFSMDLNEDKRSDIVITYSEEDRATRRLPRIVRVLITQTGS